MLNQKLLLAVAISAGLVDIALGQGAGRVWARQSLSPRQDNNQDNGGQDNGGQDNTQATCLNPAVIQQGSADDGQSQGDKGIKAGQAKSDTDANNFINFCVGKTITNGLQNTAGSCNGIVMGDIPATTQMVSTIITSPKFGDTIAPNQEFAVKLRVKNLQAGSFTNPDITYYSAPQELNAGGSIIGHVHVTCQDLGSANPDQAPDAVTTSFFKGIDDPADGTGALQATVVGGLPAGSYRCCTMSSSSNHQPVIMPVAKRGAQDDCIRFNVGQGGQANNGGGQAQGPMGGSATKNTGDGTIVSYSSAAGVAEPTGAVSDTAARKAGGRRQRGSRHRQAKQGLPKRGPVAAQSQQQAAPRPYAMA